MADALQVSGISHTYAGREFTQELFYAPQEGGPDAFSLYKVIPVKDKTNLYIPNTLSKIVRKYTSCGFTAVGNTTISDRIISTEKMKVNLEQCEHQFIDTIFAEFLRDGVDINDLRGTIIEDMLRVKVMDALRSDIPRILWFADDADADADWDMIDGYFQLALDGSANLGYILDLDSTSFETGDALATDGALGALRQMWENLPKTLRALPRSQQKIMVTCTVSDNLRTSYEDTDADAGLTLLQDGSEVLKFRGVEIVEMEGWDTHLADTTNPHNVQFGSNVIFWTVPDNLIVGADVTDPSNEVKVWYSEDNETLRTKVKIKMGAQILHLGLVAFAY